MVILTVLLFIAEFCLFFGPEEDLVMQCHRAEDLEAVQQASKLVAASRIKLLYVITLIIISFDIIPSTH